MRVGRSIDVPDRLLAGSSRMGWGLRLVETGIDGPSRVTDVLDIRPLGGLGEIAKLGRTLAEAKQTLARLQQVVVAVQADDHAVLRLDCSSCGQACQVKDWRLHRVATLFGAVWRCGSRGFVAPAVVMARRVSAGCHIAGPRLSSTSCEHIFLL
jgi:hypothetical protein